MHIKASTLQDKNFVDNTPDGLGKSNMDRPIRPRNDLESRTLLCHLSFLLSHLYPQWYMLGWREDVRAAVIHCTEGVINHVYDSMKDIMRNQDDILKRSKRSGNEIIGSFIHMFFQRYAKVAGSLADGTNRPDLKLRGNSSAQDFPVTYDLDILQMCDYPTETDGFKINTDEHYPGYFNVQDSYLNWTILYRNMSCFQFKEMDDYRKKVPAISVVQQNPITNTIRGFCLNGVSADVVCTWPCPEWPDEALIWFTRDPFTGWPPTASKCKIHNDGCHFVIATHEHSANQFNELRFSYVLAEKTLLSSLSIAQKQCFVIFKLLVKNTLPEDSNVTSYCLKTTLFWTLERVPQRVWDDTLDGIAVGFLELLNTLIHCLTEYNIPHYFNPKNNLIAHKDKEALRIELRKLLEVRRNPVTAFINFDQTYQLADLGNLIDLPQKPMLTKTARSKVPVSNPLHFVLHHTSSDHSQYGNVFLQQCLSMQQTDRYTYFSEQVKQQSIDGAIGAMEALLTNEHKSSIRSQLIFILENIEHQRDIYVDEDLTFLAILSCVLFLTRGYVDEDDRVAPVYRTQCDVPDVYQQVR